MPIWLPFLYEEIKYYVKCNNRWVIICVIDDISVSLKYILMELFTHVQIILPLRNTDKW